MGSGMKDQLTYCKILGTNINVTNMEDTIAYITDNLEELKGDYICVSNVHTTVMAYRDKEYRRVQNGGAMALPDGQPLSIVSRKRGFSEARRVPGPDLMPAILDLSQGTGYRHYFYGGTGATLEAARAVLFAAVSETADCGHVLPALPGTDEGRRRRDCQADQRQRR